MLDIPPFNAADPRAVHDILWSWSTGTLSDDNAARLLELDEDDDLLEIAANNGVPAPVRPSGP